MTGYAQPLRAIGQALEVLKIQQFDLEPVGDDFLVRGAVCLTGNDLSIPPYSQDDLRAIWGSIPVSVEEGRNENNTIGAGMVSPIELHYTLEDIDRLEEAGRARRGKSDTTPDASSLSQMLRCIGGYLNQKCARLVKVARESESITVEYVTSLGSQIRESFTVKDVYDLWVRMYLQRTERTGQ